MADGTTFEIDIDVGADSAESAAAAVARLSSQLDVAQASAAAASAAVKAGESSYRAAEAAADGAAKALERITLAADAQKGKLAKALDAGDAVGAEKAAAKLFDLTQRQAEATMKAAQAKAALDAEAASLDALRTAASGASAQEDKLSKAHDAMKTKSAALEKALPTGKANEIAEAFGKFGGPLGVAGQKAFGLAEGFKKMNAALGSGGIYIAIAAGIVAIATGVAAVTAAAVAGIATIGAWAVGLADSARTQRLLSDGIAGTVDGGKALNDQLDSLASSLPQSRDELAKMAADLRKAGFEGDALSAELERVATEAAKTKYGPDFALQMTSLTKQSERLRAGVSRIFGGLKIEKLLDGMSKLVELFDTNIASGNALKVVFESVFQPLVDAIAEWLPKARTAFIQFEIMALKALIAIKPFGSQIVLVAEVLGVLAAVVLGGLAVAVAVVTAGVAAMAVGFGVLVAAITGVIAGGVYLTAVITGAVASAFTYLQGVVTSIMTYFQTVSLEQIGIDLLTGLARGITGAGPAVLAALGGVVTSAISGAKNMLGIASPSKVFAEIGGYTAEGMAQGVDAGAADVQGSLESLVAPPDVAAAPAPAAPAGGGGGGLPSITINVNASGGDSDSIAAAVKVALLEVLEGLNAQGGTAVGNA